MSDNALERIASALEALAVAADTTKPEAFLVREVDKAGTLAAMQIVQWLRQGKHGSTTCGESPYPCVVNGQRFMVRVEIRHMGSD